MKNYAPYLMFQIARFGALTVPQMQKLCQGKCRRSSLYRALSELEKGDYVYPLLNPASRTRAYYATKEGREYVFGEEVTCATGIRTQDLDHTLQCAEILMSLCHFENVTGVSTPFEMSPPEIRSFCHERVPDGVFRLTQGGRNYELALELESSVRNRGRIAETLNRYWQTFKYGMPCTGVLIVAMDNTIFNMYTKAIAAMPDEFQTRVRLLNGPSLGELSTEAYGSRLESASTAWDLTRTTSMDEIVYSPNKTEVLIKQTTNTPHISRGPDSSHKMEVTHE